MDGGVGRSAGLVLGAVLVLRERGVLVLGLVPGGVAAWDGESGEGLAVGLG